MHLKPTINVRPGCHGDARVEQASRKAQIAETLRKHGSQDAGPQTRAALNRELDRASQLRGRIRVAAKARVKRAKRKDRDEVAERRRLQTFTTVCSARTASPPRLGVSMSSGDSSCVRTAKPSIPLPTTPWG